MLGPATYVTGPNLPSNGAGEEIRTLDPHLGKVEPAKANRINNKGMRGKKKPLTLPLTLSSGNPSTDKAAELPADLTEVAQSWAHLPPEIKAAILTLARSARREGGK